MTRDVPTEGNGEARPAARLAAPFDRLPPYDDAAERCALASAMLDRSMLPKMRQVVSSPTMFYSPDHVTIWRALCDLYDRNEPIDAVILRAELDRRGELEHCGGVAYLAELLASVPSAAHGVHYAGIVRDAAIRRGGIAAAMELERRLYYASDPRSSFDVMEALSDAIAKLWRLQSSGSAADIWALGDAVMELVGRRLDNDGKADDAWIATGVPVLDELYRGLLHAGGYALVAARPSMGKSSFTRWLLGQIAARGIKCGLISVEESKQKIAGNFLSAASGIDNRHVAYGDWGELECRELPLAAARVGRLPIVGTDRALELPEVMGTFERMVTEHGCRVIAIDHLHLLHDERSRRENRTQELTAISKRLKNAIKRLGVAGLVVAQLSRPMRTAAPEPHPPTLTDLRECGALEEHADTVMLLHRRDYYHLGDPHWTPTRECGVYIAKHRNGLTGKVTLREELRYQRFDAETAVAQMPAAETAAADADDPDVAMDLLGM